MFEEQSAAAKHIAVTKAGEMAPGLTAAKESSDAPVRKIGRDEHAPAKVQMPQTSDSKQADQEPGRLLATGEDNPT